MKLEKDQIQKVVLSSMLFAGVIYCYFTFLLGPLNAAQLHADAEVKTLEPQISDAKKQIQRTAELERKAPVTDRLLSQIGSLIPNGEPVSWFPPRLAEFLKSQGIDHVVTHLAGESAEKDLHGFRRLSWNVDLPRVEFASLGLALAGLENKEPLLEIGNVVVEGSKEDPQFQHATLEVSTLVKQ